jgi:hypothetical protein
MIRILSWSGLGFYSVTGLCCGRYLSPCLSFGWYTQVCRQAVFGTYLRFGTFLGPEVSFAFCVLLRTGRLFGENGSWVFSGSKLRRESGTDGQTALPPTYTESTYFGLPSF